MNIRIFFTFCVVPIFLFAQETNQLQKQPTKEIPALAEAEATMRDIKIEINFYFNDMIPFGIGYALGQMKAKGEDALEYLKRWGNTIAQKSSLKDLKQKILHFLRNSEGHNHGPNENLTPMQ